MRHRGCGGAQPFRGSHTLSHLLPHLHGVRPAVDPPPPLVPPSASLIPGSGCVFSPVTFWLLRDTLASSPSRSEGTRTRRPGNWREPAPVHRPGLQLMLAVPAWARCPPLPIHLRFLSVQHPSWGLPRVPLRRCALLSNCPRALHLLSLAVTDLLQVHGAGHTWLSSRPRPGASKPSPCV